MEHRFVRFRQHISDKFRKESKRALRVLVAKESMVRLKGKSCNYRIRKI